MPAAVSVPVKPGSQEWLDARQSLGIGASQGAAALGMSPWQSRVNLWAEKLGLIPPPEQTPAMRLGLLMEPVITTLYEEQEGLAPGTLRRVGSLKQHPIHSFMLATVDRTRPHRRLVELKWSERGAGYGEPGTDEVPDEILVQALHQLIVTGYEAVDVALLTGAPPVRIYPIVRNAQAEARIIERERVFWHHVETRTEPEMDGSASTRDYLMARYPRDDGTEIVADAETRIVLASALDARARAKAAEADKLAADNALRAVMGEASRLTAEGLGYVLYRQSKDRSETAWPYVAGSFRDVIDRLQALDREEVDGVLSDAFGTTDLDEIVSLYTETKPGNRPLLPKPEKESADV